MFIWALKYFVIAVLCFFSVNSYSQKLNKLGKIEVDEIPQMADHRIEKINGEYKVITDSLTFNGNTYHKIPSGYITSLIVVDNEKDYIKQYDVQGKLIATILSEKIINLKLSENGKYIAFNNSDKIIYINLNTYRVDSLSGSFVYEFLNNNKFIYYDQDTKSIWYDGNQIEIAQFPNQFIQYRDKIYIITKQNIFELVGASLIPKYEFKGAFFDSKIIDDVFYFVDKEEKRKDESFSLYKTTDFKRLILVDRLDELNR